MEEPKNPAAVALGRLGGLKGGKVTAQRRTRRQRTEAARKAVMARWAKYRRRQARVSALAKAAEAKLGAAKRFEERFGSVKLGRPTGADSASIETDLAREYGAARERTS